MLIETFAGRGNGEKEGKEGQTSLERAQIAGHAIVSTQHTREKRVLYNNHSSSNNNNNNNSSSSSNNNNSSSSQVHQETSRHQALEGAATYVHSSFSFLCTLHERERREERERRGCHLQK